MILKSTLSPLLLATLLAASPLYAADDHHNHDSHDHGSNNHSSPSNHSNMSNMFLEKRNIDGYQVSFHVMKAQAGMEHGGSHNFMVKVEKDGKIIDDIKVNSKVIYPDGKDEIKPLMKMGDWHMNGYNLGHLHGEHQLMILFKTSNGDKHKGGVYYSAH